MLTKPATATASEWSVNDHPIGSIESRAAARALMVAREESSWDEEPEFPTNFAQIIRDVRIATQTPRDYTQIPIPPGKENTLRGKLVATLNGIRRRAKAHREQIDREKGENHP